MNKSQLITIVKSLDATQAQAWYDHILTYLESHKHYPRLRWLSDKINWFTSIDTDLWTTIQKMSDLWFTSTSDYRGVARALTQYHSLTTPSVVRVPQELGKTVDNDSIVLHNISAGIDISNWDQRYSRNLDTDLQKLLG